MLNQKFFLSEELIERILSPQVKSIFLLGGPDTGKTTLIECLIKVLRDNFSLGIVDSDMGQSHIGPPTTIAWARVTEQFKSWEELKLEDFYFVGSLSPSGNINRSLEGIRFIYSIAKERTDKVIIDTTGYIQGFEAVDFKIRKMKIIQPDLVVVLQREEELEGILDCIEEFSIFKMLVPKEIKLKSQEARSLYRNRCFREYFSSAKELTFLESKFKKLDEENVDILDRIVSLQDNKGKDIALGVIKEKKDNNILILSPFNSTCEVLQIVIGFCSWHP